MVLDKSHIVRLRTKCTGGTVLSGEFDCSEIIFLAFEHYFQFGHLRCFWLSEGWKAIQYLLSFLC